MPAAKRERRNSHVRSANELVERIRPRLESATGGPRSLARARARGRAPWGALFSPASVALCSYPWMRRGFLSAGAAARPPEARSPPPPPPPRPAFPAPGALGASLRYLFSHSADGVDENLLVLLHGRGDAARAFAAFADALRLPQTARLALEGTLEVPYADGGRGWWDAVDEEGEERRFGDPARVASLANTLAALDAALDALADAGWPRHRIHLFGFSDGGTVRTRLRESTTPSSLTPPGMQVVLELALRASGAQRLGGVVAVSAALLPESLTALEAGRAAVGPNTPVLLTRGEQDEVVPLSAVLRTQTALRAAAPGCGAELVAVRGKGHAMVGCCAAEARALMTFWAHTLSYKPLAAADESVMELR